MDSLISCLMVVLPAPARVAGLKRSVDDFLRQSYRDKELIIVMDRGDAATQRRIAAYVAELQRPEIRLVGVPGLPTLGALRNYSVGEGRGAYFCQWDDDDRHHPHRLASQLQGLRESGKRALCLEEVMQFFPHDGSLFCLNWRATEPKSHPSTLFSQKTVEIHYPEAGEQAKRGEDLVVLKQLAQQGGYCVLPSVPYLYVYVSHGQNSWPQEHHRMLAEKLAISKGMLLRREAKLRQGLQPFADFLHSATVLGYNGPAFTF
jgi:glycosyltransferase involved in cell wall biosynthesis